MRLVPCARLDRPGIGKICKDIGANLQVITSLLCENGSKVFIRIGKYHGLEDFMRKHLAPADVAGGIYDSQLQQLELSGFSDIGRRHGRLHHRHSVFR